MELNKLLKEDGKTEERRNRFTGQAYALTPKEAKIHDDIFINELRATVEDKQLGRGMSEHWKEVRKGLDWFRRNNAEAYMVLLD